MLVKINAECHKFTVPLPLFILKSRFIRKLIVKKTRNKGMDFIDLNKMIKLLCKELKKFKKMNKKFVLVDVVSNDGTTVKIIL